MLSEETLKNRNTPGGKKKPKPHNLEITANQLTFVEDISSIFHAYTFFPTKNSSILVIL